VFRDATCTEPFRHFATGRLLERRYACGATTPPRWRHAFAEALTQVPSRHITLALAPSAGTGASATANDVPAAVRE